MKAERIVQAFLWMQIVFAYHAKFNQRSGDRQFWTHENHVVQLETNELIDSRLEYIHQNPVVDGFVDEPRAWKVVQEILKVKVV